MSAQADELAGSVDVDHDLLRPYAALLLRLADGRPVDPAMSQLIDEAVAVWSRPGFDQLISGPRLRFTPFEHQTQTVRLVLQRMRGRAILADEVGLGKTIEAGLVMSELRLRGLATRTLILTPAGLVGQWQEELDRKFALPSVVARGAGWSADDDRPVVIASLSAARRAPLKDAVCSREWDLVIIDEAHRVRNPRSASGRLARELRSRYLLLLTATPVENRLDDLFQLVSLIAPGLLGTASQFRRKHGGGAVKTDAGAPAVRDPAALRESTRQVMIRHRRSEVALMLPQRLAETVKVTLAPDEQSLYTAVAERVRREGRDAPTSRLMSLRHLARLAGSNPATLAPALTRIGWHDLAESAAVVRHSRKEQVLVERVRRHVDRGEKVIVFTAFTASLERLTAALAAAGISAVSYHGSLSRKAKDATVKQFRDECPVLLSTEAAGEGRNLQFCHVMINMDLPWNPMQIEQRLGRLHRIGQEHDVLLTNMVGAGTIEERILDVLESKINMFELVVGELDMILGRIEEDFDFESSVFGAYVDSVDDSEFGSRLETLGDSLARARVEYADVRESVDSLVIEAVE
jgi:SNF2 family DNA or RNA helicase